MLKEVKYLFCCVLIMKNYLRYLFSYHWHGGMLAWLLMRLCGIALAIYLGFHLWMIFWFGQSSVFFSSLLQMREQPGMRILETLLIWAVCYHAGNGIRLILIDFGLGIRWQKSLFAAVMMLSLILSTLFVYPIWHD